jgi:choline-sulfatase
MRILYLDIDSLRPDHLGCYGYHRNTSPNIDRIAAQAMRYLNCYTSDAPCLPSRTALWSGRAGIHTGVINHGGVAAEPFIEGPGRGFRSTLGQTNWMTCLRQAGLRTATVSPFGERHSAWWWYAGFNEIHNTGKGGMERADEIAPVANHWLKRHAHEDNWFLHVNLWDPHTPYRSPRDYIRRLADTPLPAWYTEQVRQLHLRSCGPHSAQEVCGFSEIPSWRKDYPDQPQSIDSLGAARAMFDGYDAGVLYADEHIGRILNALADAGVLDDTVIIVSSDHGENLGELNIYGDHQTADHITSRVPLIVRWPGRPPGVDAGLHYHFDFAATLIEQLGGTIPKNWDGQNFAATRDHLVISQGAWSCQRSVRFDDFLCIRSYHDGYHCFPDVMLFNVKDDPHEQHNLAVAHPELVARAMSLLDQWHAEMMRTASHSLDPMQTVLQEGGPLHTRGCLPAYLKRLRATGRAECAKHLQSRHSGELRP